MCLYIGDQGLHQGTDPHLGKENGDLVLEMCYVGFCVLQERHWYCITWELNPLVGF